MFSCIFGLILKLLTILFARIKPNKLLARKVIIAHNNSFVTVFTLKQTSIFLKIDSSWTNHLPVYCIDLHKCICHDMISRAQMDIY